MPSATSPAHAKARRVHPSGEPWAAAPTRLVGCACTPSIPLNYGALRRRLVNLTQAFQNPLPSTLGFIFVECPLKPQLTLQKLLVRQRPSSSNAPSWRPLMPRHLHRPTHPPLYVTLAAAARSTPQSRAVEAHFHHVLFAAIIRAFARAATDSRNTTISVTRSSDTPRRPRTAGCSTCAPTVLLSTRTPSGWNSPSSGRSIAWSPPPAPSPSRAISSWPRAVQGDHPLRPPMTSPASMSSTTVATMASQPPSTCSER